MTLYWCGVPIQRMADDDPRMGEASIIVGMPMRPKPTPVPAEQEKDYETLKREALERGRQQLQSLPPPTGPMLDWTGTTPIPKFRDRLPDEDRTDWFKARWEFASAFLDEEALRLGRVKKPD